MVGKSKRGFTDHNESRRSLILWSFIMIADDNMQDQHFMHRRVRLNECTFNQFNMKSEINVKCRPSFMCF